MHCPVDFQRFYFREMVAVVLKGWLKVELHHH